MKTYEPWKSVNGIVKHPVDEPKGPWNGDLRGPERPYMRDYSQILTMKIMLAFQDMNDRTKSDVLLRFDEALERIKQIDAITLGIPKLVYLVGWNHLGHDDKFPDWSVVNPFLCRPGSNDPVGDLRWLMQEAQKYNTTVSLHLNSSDAYQDSPLWDELLANDVIGTRNGELYAYGAWQGKTVYQIVYKNVWEKGYYKQWVDDLLAMLPELKIAGSIHSDAFLCRWTDQSSYAEEEAARRQMIRYWRDCGMDLTSEFMYGGGEEIGQDMDYIPALTANHVESSGLIGLQAYAWHLAQTEDRWFKRPASLLAGGGYPHLENAFIMEEEAAPIAFLFGCNMQGEDIVLEGCRKGTDWKTDFRNRFFTTTAMYVYLNQFANSEMMHVEDGMVLKKAQNVVAYYGKTPETRTITKDGILVRQGDNVFVPVVWIKDYPAVAAYSETGYTDRAWTLQPAWADVSAADIYEVTTDGPVLLHKAVPIAEGRVLTLSLEPKQAVCIVPAGQKI
ncbi:MAG: hypothetical protein IJ518_04145 [Clostridia bacterium]|nr:hypothetical protein [Clostridia bacterium]